MFIKRHEIAFMLLALIIILLATVPDIAHTPSTGNHFTVDPSRDGSTATLTLRDINFSQTTKPDIYNDTTMKTAETDIQIDHTDNPNTSINLTTSIARVGDLGDCSPQLPRLTIRLDMDQYSITNVTVVDRVYKEAAIPVTTTSCVPPPRYDCYVMPEGENTTRESSPGYQYPCPEQPTDGDCQQCDRLNETVPEQLGPILDAGDRKTTNQLWLARYHGTTNTTEQLDQLTVRWNLTKHVPQERLEDLFPPNTDLRSLLNTSSVRRSKETGELHDTRQNELIVQTDRVTLRQQIYISDTITSLNRSQCGTETNIFCYREFGHRNVRVRSVLFTEQLDQEQLETIQSELESYMKARIDDAAFSSSDQPDETDSPQEALSQGTIFDQATQQDCEQMISAYETNMTSCSETEDRYNCAFQAIHYIPSLAEQCPRDAHRMCERRNNILANRDSGQTLQNSYQSCHMKTAEQVYDENITAAIEYCTTAEPYLSCRSQIAEQTVKPDRIAHFNKSSIVSFCASQPDPDRKLCYSSIGHLFTLTNQTRAEEYCNRPEETPFEYNVRECQTRIAQVLMYEAPSQAEQHCEQLSSTGTTSCFQAISRLE